MKRITLVGLSLFAVLAFSAITSSSAFAGEYGVCVKAAKVGKTYTGKYTDKNCSVSNAKSEGKYEWSPYPGPAGTVWTTTSTSKVSTLSTSQGSITCNKNTDTGEVTGTKSNIETVTFTDCTNNVFGTNCYNVETTKEGGSGGTIIVVALTQLIDHGEEGGSGLEPAEGEVWNEFLPVVVFYCKTPLGEDPFFITGSASGVVGGDVNKMSPKSTVTFGAGKGEQDLISNTASDEPPYSEVHLTSTLTSANAVKQKKTEVKAGNAALTPKQLCEGAIAGRYRLAALVTAEAEKQIVPAIAAAMLKHAEELEEEAKAKAAELAAKGFCKLP